MRAVKLSKELCEAIRAYNEVTDAVVDLKAELERTPEWQTWTTLNKQLLVAESSEDHISEELIDKCEAARLSLARLPLSDRLERATKDRRHLGKDLTPLVEAELGIRTTKMSAS